MKSRMVSFTKSSEASGTQNTKDEQYRPQMSMMHTMSDNSIDEYSDEEDGNEGTNATESDMRFVPEKTEWSAIHRGGIKVDTPSEHIQKYGVGAQIMMKMGYQEGKGLGMKQEGIVNPIQTKLRPQGLGVGAINERTDDRMEVDSSDDEMERKRPKIDLFEIIRNLENKGVEVPLKFKELSDSAQGDNIGAHLYQQLEENYKILSQIDNDLQTLGQQETFLQFQIDKSSSKLLKQDSNISLAKNFLRLLEETKSHLVGLPEEEDRIVYVTSVLEKITHDEFRSFEMAKKIFISVIQDEMKQLFVNHFDDFKNYEGFFMRTLMEWLYLYKKIGDDSSTISEEWDSLIYDSLFCQLRKLTEKSTPQQFHSEILVILREWFNNHVIIDENLGVMQRLRDEFVIPLIEKQVESWAPACDTEGFAPHVYVVDYLSVISLDKSNAFGDLLRSIFSKFNEFVDFLNPISLWDSTLFKTGEVKYKEAVLMEIRRILNVWGIIFDRYMEEGSSSKLEATILASIVRFLGTTDVVSLERKDQMKLDLVFDIILDMLDLGHVSLNQILISIQFTLMNRIVEELYNQLGKRENARYVAKWFFTWFKYFKNRSRLLSHPDITRMIEWYFNTSIERISLLHEGGAKAKPLVPTLFGSSSPPLSTIVDTVINYDAKLINVEAQSTNVEGIPSYALTSSFKDAVQKYCTDHALLMSAIKRYHPENGLPLYRIESFNGNRLLAYISEDVLWVSSDIQDIQARVFEPLSLDQLSQRLY